MLKAKQHTKLVYRKNKKTKYKNTLTMIRNDVEKIYKE